MKAAGIVFIVAYINCVDEVYKSSIEMTNEVGVMKWVLIE